jgi:uncharacterized small protein (DUF1192 family)
MSYEYDDLVVWGHRELIEEIYKLSDELEELKAQLAKQEVKE